MKWFFAFNEHATLSYGDMIRVAVDSARRHTTLEAHCLYDGAETPLTAWLAAQGVTIWPTQSRFKSLFEEKWRQSGDESLKIVAPGALLRLEIPRLMCQAHMKDKRVLYTDIDVVFQHDPMPVLETISPRLFAVAPESWRDNLVHMNSGVMLLNVPALIALDPRFIGFTRRHLDQVILNSWDQGAYRAFFDPWHRFLWKIRVPDRVSYKFLLSPRWSLYEWDALPPELNWKPYWGPNAAASIVHFHGPKPVNRLKLQHDGPHHVHRTLYNEHFEAWCDFWETQRALLPHQT